MMVDAKKILDRVRSGETKERITISVDKEVLDHFKKFIGERPISPVVEELMREFNEAADPGAGSVGFRRQIADLLPAVQEDQLSALFDQITRLAKPAADIKKGVAHVRKGHT